MTRPAWMDDAACDGYPTAWWHPGSAVMSGRAPLNQQAAKAVHICRGCPVRELCLEWALRRDADESVMQGIWGGLLPWQRARLLKIGRRAG